MTVGQYGQVRKGVLQEGLLKRRLVSDAVNSPRSFSARSGSSAFIRTELPPTKAGHAVSLKHSTICANIIIGVIYRGADQADQIG